MRRGFPTMAGRAAVAAVAVPILFLAGCSGGSSSGSDVDAYDPDAEVTIEMSWWGDDKRAALFDEVITAFEAEHPNITVKQTPVGSPDDLFNRLATDFGGGGSTAPDIFALGGAKPQEFGEAGALLDLAEVADVAQIEKYPEISTASAVVDGKLYGLPTGGNATAAFVNTDILAQAGIAPPEEGWTWDDLIDIANEVGSAGLTNAQGAPVYGLDLRVSDIIGTYAAQQSEYGIYNWEGELDIDAGVLEGWYEKELEMLDGGGLPDPTIITAGWALPPDQQLYTLGQAAVTFGYSNLISTYSGAGSTEILPPPTDSDDNGVALLPSAYWAINAASANPVPAAMLMDWFLNEPAAAELIKDTRGVPFNPDTAAVVVPLLEGGSQVAAEYVETMLEAGTVAPPQPNGGANMNKYTQDGEAEVLFGRQSPQEAGQAWIDKLSADLR